MAFICAATGASAVTFGQIMLKAVVTLADADGVSEPVEVQPARAAADSARPAKRAIFMRFAFLVERAAIHRGAGCEGEDGAAREGKERREDEGEPHFKGALTEADGDDSDTTLTPLSAALIDLIMVACRCV